MQTVIDDHVDIIREREGESGQEKECLADKTYIGRQALQLGPCQRRDGDAVSQPSNVL